MNKSLLGILSFTILLILIGCKQPISLEQTLFVDSMGLDYNIETKDFEIYYHIASSSSLITTELGGLNNEVSYSIGKIKAKSIYEGLNELTFNSVKNIVLTHIQSVICTFDFLYNDNLKTIINICKDYKYISLNLYFFATKAKLSELYTMENPENLSPFYSIITNNNSISTIDLTYFSEVSRSQMEKHLTTKLIVIDIDKDLWKNKKENITTIIPTGNVYLDKDCNLIYITTKENPILKILNFEESASFAINNINYTLHRGKVKIKYKNNRFIIKLSGEITPTNISKDNSMEIKKIFENYIKDEFDKLVAYSKKQNIDIFNLKDKLYRMNKLKDDYQYIAIPIDLTLDYKLSY